MLSFVHTWRTVHHHLWVTKTPGICCCTCTDSGRYMCRRKKQNKKKKVKWNHMQAVKPIQYFVLTTTMVGWLQLGYLFWRAGIANRTFSAWLRLRHVSCHACRTVQTTLLPLRLQCVACKEYFSFITRNLLYPGSNSPQASIHANVIHLLRPHGNFAT